MPRGYGRRSRSGKRFRIHLQNLNIDLLEYEQPAPRKSTYATNHIGAMHLCFEVDDIDAVYQRMRDAGLIFQGEPIVFEAEDQLKAGIGTAVPISTIPTGPISKLSRPWAHSNARPSEGQEHAASSVRISWTLVSIMRAPERRAGIDQIKLRP